MIAGDSAEMVAVRLSFPKESHLADHRLPGAAAYPAARPRSSSTLIASVPETRLKGHDPGAKHWAAQGHFHWGAVDPLPELAKLGSGAPHQPRRRSATESGMAWEAIPLFTHR